MKWRTTNIWFASGLFQVVWLVLVMFRADAQWWFFLPWLVCLSYFCLSSRSQFIFCLQVFSIGLIVDSVNYGLGIYAFPENSLLIPFWLVVLWGCFTVYATQLMRGLSSLPLLFLLGVGGLGGCLSYNAAYHLGAVYFPLTVPVTSIIIFTQWVGVTYAMAKLYCR